MSRPAWSRPRLAAFGTALVVLIARPSQAVSPAPELQAALRAGACAQPGSLTAGLQALRLPSGPAQGATSFTPAPMTLTTLLATPHVITIAGTDTVVVCGTLGSILAPDGSLTVVLRPESGHTVFRLAFIAASGSRSLFVDPLARLGLPLAACVHRLRNSEWATAMSSPPW